jgi:hypothetical protein
MSPFRCQAARFQPRSPPGPPPRSPGSGGRELYQLPPRLSSPCRQRPVQTRPARSPRPRTKRNSTSSPHTRQAPPQKVSSGTGAIRSAAVCSPLLTPTRRSVMPSRAPPGLRAAPTRVRTGVNTRPCVPGCQGKVETDFGTGGNAVFHRLFLVWEMLSLLNGEVSPTLTVTLARRGWEVWLPAG